MQLSERAREIGVRDSRVDETSVEFARQALARELARSGRTDQVRHSRRRTWTGLGVGGLVAGAAVTAIVVGSVLAPPIAPDAAAADVLERAAAVTFDA